MRVTLGGISHETHTSSTVRTTFASFQEQRQLRGEDVLTLQGTETPAGGAIDGAREQAMLHSPALYAEAMPGGIIAAHAYADLLSQLLQEIELANPLDGILLLLHGAMVIEGIDDGEGDLLQKVRSMVGQEVPIVATLDFHANIRSLMVEQADVLVGYDTYPRSCRFHKACTRIGPPRGRSSPWPIMWSKSARSSPSPSLVTSPTPTFEMQK
jgi:microcystin degradation protein MlrC